MRNQSQVHPAKNNAPKKYETDHCLGCSPVLLPITFGPNDKIRSIEQQKR